MANSLVPTSLNHSFDFEAAKDESNPRSLVNILPMVASNAVKAIPDELFAMDIDQLKKRAVGQRGKSEEIDLLRTAWWIEYNRAQNTATRFMMCNVYNGITYSAHFKKDFIGNSFRLLYIITPPVDYAVQQQNILNVALAEELRILKLDIEKDVFNKDGDVVGKEVDTKLLAVKQKIADSVKNRVMGMPVNRTMQINQNFNSNGPVNTNRNGAAKVFEQMDEAELQAFIDENSEKQKAVSRSEDRDVIEVSKKSSV